MSMPLLPFSATEKPLTTLPEAGQRQDMPLLLATGAGVSSAVLTGFELPALLPFPVPAAEPVPVLPGFAQGQAEDFPSDTIMFCPALSLVCTEKPLSAASFPTVV